MCSVEGYTLDMYVRQIEAIRPMDRDEEVSVAKRMEVKGDDAIEARRRFISAYLTLVYATAREYESTQIPIFKLMQEGNIALMRAVDRFDYRDCDNFASFAAPLIRQEMEKL